MYNGFEVFIAQNAAMKKINLTTQYSSVNVFKLHGKVPAGSAPFQGKKPA